MTTTIETRRLTEKTTDPKDLPDTTYTVKAEHFQANYSGKTDDYLRVSFYRDHVTLNVIQGWFFDPSLKKYWDRCETN